MLFCRRLLSLALIVSLSACAAPPLLDTATLTPTPTLPYPHTPPPTLTPTSVPTLEPTATALPLPPKVLIISIDGLRPDGLLAADAPNILALAQRGSYTWDAQTVFPPVTLPSHASMLSGDMPDVHGLTWNDNLPGRGNITVPTLLSIAHEAGYRTAMVVGKEKLTQLNAPGSVDAYVYATGGDQDVADQAVAQIQTGFDLMFVHLPNTDYFGHLTGWMSATYIVEIAGTDSAVGRILTALPENTTVILTADHGGHDKIHGSNTPTDMTIPWIIAGPNVLADHLLDARVNTTDTAATAAYVFGLSLPPDAVGRPVYEAFGQTAPDLLRGTWRGGTAQTPARSEMPAAVLNGLIYVPGGFGGETVFQAYDPGGEAWIDLAPLPSGRHHAMAAAVDGKIYLFGGAAVDSESGTSNVSAYDPDRNSWTEKSPMPEPRLAGSAVTLDGKIFIVGGVGESQDLLAYDPGLNSWRRLAALNHPREHLAAAALGGEIYALGGRWAGLGETNSVEIYDPGTDTWRDGPPLLRRRSGFGAAVIGDHILVAGGEIVITGNETLASVEVFAPDTQTWSFAPDMPIALHGLAAAAVDNRLYLLGGSSRAGAIDNMGRALVYTP